MKSEKIIAAVEKLMLDNIYYIGDQLPQTPDKRPKFVILGSPASFLEALKKQL